jgi:hypothetical protein
MMMKKFIVWTKRIHLLTMDENIHYQYEQKVFIIWDLVRTQNLNKLKLFSLYA